MKSQSPEHLPSFSRFLTHNLSRIFTGRRIAAVGLLLGAFLLLTPAMTYAYFARDIGDREHIMNRKETGVVLKDRNGEIFYRQGTVNIGDDVPLTAIADNLEKAAIASEDKEFYEHEGYSVRGIAAALYANVLNKDATRYGGSTITQQLVKNRLLSSDKSFIRKYQEVSMAVALERKYTKQEILEMYLNSVYFGEGAFGIRDAAKTYFGKAPAELTLAESSMLIGLLPAPNLYSPVSGDAEKAKAQQTRVLEHMAEDKTITATEKEQALAQNLSYAAATDDVNKHAQHYAMMVIEELRDKYGEERISRAGYEVTTALDLNKQRQAEEVVRRRVATFQNAGGRNAGLVAIDPKNGEVQVLVGSVDWSNQTFGKVNMATSARQPGSSFKPIYYAEAIDRGVINAATILHDKKTTFGDWTPENYDFKFRGDIPVRHALALSLNIPAAEVMQKLGPIEASKAARRMGITTVTEPEKYGLTLSLGTAETELYEMTNAYAAFANQGNQHDPVLITAIQDKYGKKIFEREPTPPRQVIGPEAAFIISSILSDQSARAQTFGSSLNIPGRQAAAKTGTTNDNKDAWTIGYTPNLAVGVWVGNNENQPMSGLAGASSAGVIWRESMTTLLSGMPVEQFARPAGIVQMQVCKQSGLRAVRGGEGVYTEYFKQGFVPSGECRQQKQESKEDVQRGRDKKRDDNHDNDDDEASVPVQPQQQAQQPAPQPQPTIVQPPDNGGRGAEDHATDAGETVEVKPNNKPEKPDD